MFFCLSAYYYSYSESFCYCHHYSHYYSDSSHSILLYLYLCLCLYIYLLLDTTVSQSKNDSQTTNDSPFSPTEIVDLADSGIEEDTRGSKKFKGDFLQSSIRFLLLQAFVFRLRYCSF